MTFGIKLCCVAVLLFAVNPPVSATKSESSDDEHKPTPEYNSPSGGQASQPIAIEVRRGSNQSNLTPFSVISMPLVSFLSQSIS